jgi:hypothetical protein
MAYRNTAFVNFLEHTLIPDLREGGKTSTAQDLQDCARAIKRGRKSAALSSYRARVGRDQKSAGYVETAKDYAKCARLVKPGGRR